MYKLLKQLFPKLMCTHKMETRGWSYIKCSMCGKVVDDPNESARLRNEHVSSMVEKGYWKKSDALDFECKRQLTGRKI